MSRITLNISSLNCAELYHYLQYNIFIILCYILYFSLKLFKDVVSEIKTMIIIQYARQN